MSLAIESGRVRAFCHSTTGKGRCHYGSFAGKGNHFSDTASLAKVRAAAPSCLRTKFLAQGRFKFLKTHSCKPSGYFRFTQTLNGKSFPGSARSKPTWRNGYLPVGRFAGRETRLVTGPVTLGNTFIKVRRPNLCIRRYVGPVVLAKGPGYNGPVSEGEYGRDFPPSPPGHKRE